MSLRGYKPKTRKAPWTSAFPEQCESANRTGANSKPSVHGGKRRPTTPLTAATSRSGSTPPKKLRAVSRRRVKTNTAYRLKARAFLAMHPVCGVCGERTSAEVHHTRGRAGTLLLDERFWMPVDHECHRKIHDHMDDARRAVWTRPDGTTLPMIAARGDWGRSD
jgi:hypothetical protein